MSSFFSMGGYAAFVWTAYGVAAAGLAGLGLASWRRMRLLERKADMLRAARRSRA